MIASTPTRRSGISFDESIISGNVNSTDTRINDLLRRVESLEMDKCLVAKNRASPACSVSLNFYFANNLRREPTQIYSRYSNIKHVLLLNDVTGCTMKINDLSIYI